jgi:hypothetical protein
MKGFIMTVENLIKVLQQYPKDAVVRVLGLDYDDEISYFPVSSSCPWKDSKTGIEYIDL